ncbi:Zonadhesin [Actinoplanes friuliensis DSM 7358]|uniref:Zonadhesin n=1 Tax=Actinoplanes friuliensis DSM 7358 TaxID=1246995 RepID=U5VS47_9ACTN|nr:Zonadhesin [Actinoplanes friuliensis DSM 7358]
MTAAGSGAVPEAGAGRSGSSTSSGPADRPSSSESSAAANPAGSSNPPAGPARGSAKGPGTTYGTARSPEAADQVRSTRSGRSPWSDLEGGFEPDERADDLITAYPSARPGPAGAIHGVGVTALVTNLERSVAFYREMLGFYEIDMGSGSAVLASGDMRLVLRTVRDLSSGAGRQIYLNLEVGDVEAVYEELKRKGVKFVHGPRPVNRGDKLELWAASFHDPDDHNIAITQWRAIR